MLTAGRSLLRDWRDRRQLPPAAKAEAARDKEGVPGFDPGIEPAVHSAIRWLMRSQKQSASHDGGSARDFSLIRGWSVSYPETTGYIVPTMIGYGRRYNDPSSIECARRMLDWLVSLQFPDGGFMGGKIDAEVRVPVSFNTGQILLGLAAGVAEFGEVYRQPMRKAANWLRNSLDPDGCWRKYPTPFAKPGDKTYETHASWGLLEAEKVDPGQGYAGAAIRQVNWALTQQQANGWLANCCLTNSHAPLTHTLGYALRGFMEAHRFTQDAALLAKAIKLADGLQSVLCSDGFLPGLVKSDWQAAANWSCLTGNVQIAHGWLMLYEVTGEMKYFEAAALANRYVRRTMQLDGPEDIRGAVKGSFPVDAPYCSYQYPNWAAKFMIDANLLEFDARHGG